MSDEKKRQNHIDSLYLNQVKLERSLEDLRREQRHLAQVQEEVLDQQSRALYHFNDLVTLGITPSHVAFYQNLVDDIDRTRRHLEVDFAEQQEKIKRQMQIYQDELETTQDKRRKLLAESDD